MAHKKAKKKKVSFWATKIVKKPVKVSFRTYDGQKITFWATKAVEVPKKVTFFTKKKKKK